MNKVRKNYVAKLKEVVDINIELGGDGSRNNNNCCMVLNNLTCNSKEYSNSYNSGENVNVALKVKNKS